MPQGRPDGSPDTVLADPASNRVTDWRPIMGISKGSGEWQGGFKTGKGTMKPAHGPDVGFSAGSRFEGQPSSNPEELIGAALSGCFSMALTLAIEKAGATPGGVRTSADVSLDKGDGGFSVTGIKLSTTANVSGMDEAAFKALAEDTKKNCPIGKLLSSVPITLDARLQS
jgi:osmotically inducible protein OsmC